MEKQKPSFARVMVTPLVLLIPGYLILGIYGLAIATVVGIIYVLWAMTR